MLRCNCLLSNSSMCCPKYKYKYTYVACRYTLSLGCCTRITFKFRTISKKLGKLTDNRAIITCYLQSKNVRLVWGLYDRLSVT
jgi:hypothetical protein